MKHMHFLAAVMVLAGGPLVGCDSSEDPATSSNDAGSGGEGGSEGGAGGLGGAGGEGGDGAGGQGGEKSPECLALEAELQGALEDGVGTAPGAFLGVRTPQCGVWIGTVGEAAPGIPLAPDNSFRIGSVTKTFIAAAVLQLVEEQELALDDAIGDWVPSFPSGDVVTVRMALNHTSGVFNYTNDASFFDDVLADPSHVWAPQDLLDVAAANPPYFEPGASWEYSNTNYIGLGMLIEAIEQAPLHTVLRERLFAPYEIDGLSLDGARPLQSDLAHGYLSNGTDVTTTFDQSWAWAAGAMVGTPADLLSWSKALYAGDVLTDESRAAMFESVPTGAPGLEYGLGMFALDPSVAYVDTVGHMGDTLGYHTHMFYMLDRDISLVSAVLSDGANVNAITLNAVEILALD